MECLSDCLHLLAPILPMPPNGAPNVVMADLIHLLSTWIARIGGLVAFAGAVKLAISFNMDDARDSVLAVLTMVSGFMIRVAVNSLDIFSIPATYSDAAAQQEFQQILHFIGTWIGRVGGFGMFVGAIIFGFAAKDSDAAAKLKGIKAMGAGAMVVAVSGILYTFV